MSTTYVTKLNGSNPKSRTLRIVFQARTHSSRTVVDYLLAVATALTVGLSLTFGLICPVHAQAQTAAKPDHSIAGTWQATLHAPNGNLRAVLIVKKTPAGKLTGVFYSIDQGGQPISLSPIRFNNDSLTYVNSYIGIVYRGKMSAGGNTITGTQTQMGHSFPLIYERATPETAWTIPPPRPHIAPMAANATPGIEVATINPSKPGTRETYIMWRGDQLAVKNFSLADLIKFAYHVQNKQILSGPDWVSTDRFDIQAKPNIPGTPSPEQLGEMVKKLLVERFQLKMHAEHKVMSAYVLTVAKGGPRMTKNPDSQNEGLPGIFFGPPIMTLRVHDATMPAFVSLMQSVVLDRPLVDHTGLAGHWNFSLHWMPDATQFGGRKMPPPSQSEVAPPPLSTALRQQLGLKLGLEKTSVPVLVIDHVDHPSPN